MKILDKIPEVEESFDDFDYLEDLIWYDGPLASVYLRNNVYYYAHACDFEEFTCRWLFVAVEKSTIDKMKNNEIAVKDVMVNPIDGKFLIIDFYGPPGSMGGFTFKKTTKLEDIPEDYFPVDGVKLARD